MEHILIIGNYLTNQSKDKIDADKVKLNEFSDALEKKLEEYTKLVSDAEEKIL